MNKSSFGKPLKGVGVLSAKITEPIENSIYNVISTGGLIFTNIIIEGGTIDGVTTGSTAPGPGNFTTITSGTPTGSGYSVCFYGQTVGDSACWEPVLGRWKIQGDLLVRDISDLGNIRVSTNTISSTNTNGNIIVDPNGSGSILLSGPLIQNTTNGNITFNTNNGLYSLNTSSSITTNSGTSTSLTTVNGDITLDTGSNIPSNTINFITTGSTPIITTTTAHNLIPGDSVTISGTDSIPNINGVYTVTSTPSTTSFQITTSSPVTTIGINGSVVKHNDIYLTATNNVNIPVDTGLTFGGDTQKIISDSFGNLTMSSNGDINFTPSTGSDINIPNNIGLTFGSDTRKIESNGTDVTLDVTGGNFVVNNDEMIVNGKFTVNGVSTHIFTTTLVADDQVITLGGDTAPIADTGMDSGIEGRWHNGVSPKLFFFGFDRSTECFTYIPDATNTGEVFSGTPGCARFGGLTATSLNIQGGSLSNVGSLNTCSITCSSTMTISATNAININSPYTTISNSNLTIGQNVTDDNKDRGILVNVNNGSPIQNWFGVKDNTNTFTYLTNVTDSSGVITGTIGDAEFGGMTLNGMMSLSTEHLSAIGGGIMNPSNLKGITFIKVTSSGIATGTLPVGVKDGDMKYIMIVSLASGGSYQLSCPNGRLLDPGSGSTAAKTLKFESAGQGVSLIWNSVDSMYIVVNGGACIV